MITKPKISPKKKKDIVTPQTKDKVKPQGKVEAKKEVDVIDAPFRVVLTVPVLATYLKRGVGQAEIARICGCSRQAVDQFIDRHSEALHPLIDKDDGLIAMKAKYVHDKAMGKLIDLVDSAGPKDMMALNVVSGTHFDKYRIGSNQSTQNISIGHRFMSLQDEAEEVKVINP